MKYRNIFLILFLCAGLAACSGEASAGGETETAEEAATQAAAKYPDTILAEDPGGENNETFGIMHACILDVQNDSGGNHTLTVRDDFDPENAWTVDTALVKDVSLTPEKGMRAAILFRGDIIGDPDSVEMIAVWPDGDYQLKSADGTTIANTINDFDIKADAGAGYARLTFVKNNCLMDKDAMEGVTGDRIRVVYADGGSDVKYPLRIFRLEKKEK